MYPPSLWHSQVDSPDHGIMDGDCAVETVIIGGGLTGLWTAFYLKQAQPEASVLMIDAQDVGFGASGRNGGWCIGELAAGRERWDQLAGPGAGLAMESAMLETVDEIERVVAENALDCDFVRGGELHLARNSGQAGRLRRWAEDSDRTVWIDKTEAEAMCGATQVQGGVFVSSTAVLHPAKLVLELARHLSSNGVHIRSRTTAIRVESGKVYTNRGIVTAQSVVVATEGYTRSIEGYRRSLIPLASAMIATEPLSRDHLDQVGLVGRPAFTDGRFRVIYGQRTADDRIAFGGRASPYSYGSAIPGHNGHGSLDSIYRSLLDLFPFLEGVDITHRWGGVMGATRNWTPFVELETDRGVFRSGGLVGEGVAATSLAGRTMAAAISNPTDSALNLPWVRKASRPWPVEPLRWAGIGIGTVFYDLADRYEDRTDRSAGLFETLVGWTRK